MQYPTLLLLIFCGHDTYCHNNRLLLRQKMFGVALSTVCGIGRICSILKTALFFNDGYCRKWVFSNLHRSLCKLTRSSFQFLKSVFFSFGTVQFIVTNVWPEMYIITDASTDTLTYSELHSSLSLLSFPRYFVRWIGHSVVFNRLWFACSVLDFVVVYAIVSSEPSSKFQVGLFA